MKKRNTTFKIIAFTGITSLILLPGLAFGSLGTTSLNLNWSAQPICPPFQVITTSSGSIELEILDSGTGVYHAFATKSPTSGSTYQDGTNLLTSATAIWFMDGRSRFINTSDSDCLQSPTQEGFTLTATADDFCTDYPTCSGDTISADNFYIITTDQVNPTHVTDYSLYGGVYIKDLGGPGAIHPPFGDGLATISSPHFVAATVDLTDINAFLGPDGQPDGGLDDDLGAPLDGIVTIVDNTGHADDNIYSESMIIFPAFYLQVPNTTPAGTYTTQITWTFSPEGV